MATAVGGMKFDAAEEVGDDGMTHLQRKVLYQLICKGELTIATGGNHERDLAVGLHLQPSVNREISRAMEALVRLGRVKRHDDTKLTNVYGKRYDVHVADGYKYVPINPIGSGNNVLAWVALYGPLTYEEIAAPAGEPLYSSDIAPRMGESAAREQQLRGFAAQAIAQGLLQETAEARPDTQGGSKGKQYPVMKTTVTLALVE